MVLAILIVVAAAFPSAQQTPLFSFHSNAWLNLHHYVRANARGGPAPTGLSEDERTQWAAGVEFYKPYVPRDLLLDDGMVAIKYALRGAEGKTSLDGITIDAAQRAARSQAGINPGTARVRGDRQRRDADAEQHPSTHGPPEGSLKADTTSVRTLRRYAHSVGRSVRL
jgi:hypothetical protein